MSTINGRKQAGHGVGGGYASIDNVPFSVGGWGGWLSDREGFFANGDDAWTCAIYNQETRTIVRAVTDPADPLYGKGMNTGFADGGVWAAWLSGTGLFASTGMRVEHGGLFGVGPTGEIAYTPEYQDGVPVLVRERDGAEWTLTGEPCYDLQLLGGRRAIWTSAQRVRVAGLPQPLQLDAAYGVRACEVNGRWWLAYWCEAAGVVLHPFDSLTGVVVVPAGVDAWFSLRAFGSVIHFAISNGPGEQPGQMRTVDINTLTETFYPLDGDDGGGGDGGDDVAPPIITITSYAPSSGTIPLTVTAHWATQDGSGPVTQLSWQSRSLGASTWVEQGVRSADVPAFDYVFSDAGTYELRLVAIGPGGEAWTGAQRLVTATTKAPDPEPQEACMIYVDSGQPNLGAYPCEEVPGEGAGRIGLKLPNGKYLGLDLNDPAGPWREADSVGAWESFSKASNALVMDVTWDGVRHTFIRPCVMV